MSEQAMVTAAEVARLAGVGRAAVGNWRRRHPDFPRAVGGSDSSPTFRLAEVRGWLRAQGKLGVHSLRELAWQEVEAAASGRSVVEAVGVAAAYLAGATGTLPVAVRQALDDLSAEVGAETAVEQLCARLVEAYSRQLVVTPPELADLMVELAGDVSGPVLDPACGIGSLLRAVPGAGPVLGQEIDVGLAALARVRLAFGHDAPQVRVGDSLRADAFPGVEAAAVVCNPPFAVRQWGADELGYDPRWVYGLPPRGESELAWVQHCLAHLRPGGRAVLVLPPGVASRRSGRPIRAELLRRGALRAIVSLPAGAAAPSHLAMHLWVLEQPGGAPLPRGLLLVDAAAGTPARIDELGWPTVVERVRAAWRLLDTDEPGDGGSARIVPVVDLLDDDVDLTPGRRLPVAADPSDVEPIRRRLVALLDSLGALLPAVAPAAGASRRPMTTVGELAKQGMVLVRQQSGRVDIATDGPGDPVLTARDVIAGRVPTGRLAGKEPLDAVRLRPGDVVVPTVAPRPVALVVEQEAGALLGPNLQLLRPDRDRLDPWFLAGFLRSGEAVRAASSLSGTYRIDVRRVELPRVPPAEQRRLAKAFRRLAEFGSALATAGNLGSELERTLLDGIAAGLLEPSGNIPETDDDDQPVADVGDEG